MSLLEDIKFKLRTNTVVFKPDQDNATVDILISGNNIGKRDAFVISGKSPNANYETNVTIAGLVIIENYYCELTCDEPVYVQQYESITHAHSYITKISVSDLIL